MDPSCRDAEASEVTCLAVIKKSTLSAMLLPTHPHNAHIRLACLPFNVTSAAPLSCSALNKRILYVRGGDGGAARAMMKLLPLNGISGCFVFLSDGFYRTK